MEMGNQLGGYGRTRERHSGGLQWRWRGSSVVLEAEVVGIAEE